MSLWILISAVHFIPHYIYQSGSSSTQTDGLLKRGLNTFFKTKSLVSGRDHRSKLFIYSETLQFTERINPIVSTTYDLYLKFGLHTAISGSDIGETMYVSKDPLCRLSSLGTRR